jgi:hypothetical protein
MFITLDGASANHSATDYAGFKMWWYSDHKGIPFCSIGVDVRCRCVLHREHLGFNDVFDVSGIPKVDGVRRGRNDEENSRLALSVPVKKVKKLALAFNASTQKTEALLAKQTTAKKFKLKKDVSNRWGSTYFSCQVGIILACFFQTVAALSTFLANVEVEGTSYSCLSRFGFYFFEFIDIGRLEIRS